MQKRIRIGLMAGVVFVALLIACGHEKKPKYQPRYQTYSMPLDASNRTAAQLPAYFDSVGYKKAVAEAEEFKKDKEQEIASLEADVKQRFRYRQEVLNKTKEVDAFCVGLRQQADSVLGQSSEILRKRDYKAVENLVEVLALFTKTTSATLHYLATEYPPMVESLKTDTEALRRIAQYENEIETRFNYLKSVEAKKDEVTSATKRLLSCIAPIDQTVKNGVQKQDFAILNGGETEAAYWIERFSGSRFDSYAGAMVREFEKLSLDIENQIAEIPPAELRKYENRRTEIQGSYAKETDVNLLEMLLSELEFLADMAQGYGPLYLEKEYQKSLAAIEALKGDVKKHIEVCQLCASARARVNVIFKKGLQRRAGRELDRLKQKLRDFTAKAPNEASAALLWSLMREIDNGIQGSTRKTYDEVQELYLQPVRLEGIDDYSKKIKLAAARLAPLEKFYLELGKAADLTSVTKLKSEVEYKVELVEKVKTFNRKLSERETKVNYILRAGRVLSGSDMTKLTQARDELEEMKKDYEMIARDPGLRGIAESSLTQIQGLIRKCTDSVSSQVPSR
jgi:hypothetical protein